jgi:hypothetical protein
LESLRHQKQESESAETGAFSPQRGGLSFRIFFPRLAPWAAFFRRFAAGMGEKPVVPIASSHH